MSSGASTTGAGRGLQDYSRMPQFGMGDTGMYQPGGPPMAPGDTLVAQQGMTGMYQPGAAGGAPMASQQMQPFGMPGAAQTGMYQTRPMEMGAPPGMAQPGVTTSPQMLPFGLAQTAAAGMNGMYQTRPMGVLQQPQTMGGLAGQRQYGQGMNGMYGGY